MRTHRWDRLSGKPRRFFLCFSLSKDLHVLLCGGKLLNIPQDQTLNSLFSPSYHSVPQALLLVPSQPNGRANFHPNFSAFIILVLQLTQKPSPPFLPRDTKLNCRVRSEYVASIWFSYVPTARRSDSDFPRVCQRTNHSLVKANLLPNPYTQENAYVSDFDWRVSAGMDLCCAS